jgi:hypothetical protein
LIHSTRLSLMKGAHADLSCTAWQEIGVKPYFGLSGIPQRSIRFFLSGRLWSVGMRRVGRQNSSYGRPESRSLLRASQSKAPICEARSRMRSSASWEVSATSRATGFPRRVTMTASPRSTRSSKALHWFLASETPTVIILFLPLSQLKARDLSRRVSFFKQ